MQNLHDMGFCWDLKNDCNASVCIASHRFGGFKSTYSLIFYVVSEYMLFSAHFFVDLEIDSS